MVKNIYLLLGLNDGAPWPEVKRAYAKQIELWTDDNICCPCHQLELLKEARQHLSKSWEHMRQIALPPEENKSSAAYDKAQAAPDFCQPKLGQLLVAAGVISLDELNAYLEIQRNTHQEHIPLGHLLVASEYLTLTELDYYLQLQQVLKLPSDHPQRWGKRLIELGLIDDDQLKVALIDQKTSGCTLREALINRGWLTGKILDRIF